jgi:hypothetical protein
MNADDIQQRLALLPEGWAQSNLQSWNEVVKFFGGPVDVVIVEHFPYILDMYELAKAFSMSEQAKLFRAEGGSPDTLIISTTDGQVKIGEPHLMVFIDRGFLTAQYGIDEEGHKYNFIKRLSDNIYFRTGNSAITFLQPMLDLLWNETRGKKNS